MLVHPLLRVQAYTATYSSYASRKRDKNSTAPLSPKTAFVHESNLIHSKGINDCSEIK